MKTVSRQRFEPTTYWEKNLWWQQEDELKRAYKMGKSERKRNQKEHLYSETVEIFGRYEDGGLEEFDNQKYI